VARRHYLVVTRDLAARSRVGVRVKAAGGVVLIALPHPALLVEMSDATKDEIASSPDVRHCGGVELAPRPIRRIRVGPDGARLNA
jgi:hypothetical protein